ncbi:hypothetical protein ACIPYS_21445 [Kitasatospora sp. NPDC089913]|uniref:golvesin C-terminal-like domain-containing protein n=1 Tax=Kitasatospora sp. NPDC089913 TaxID=3364080 RepID=UPI0037F1214F
MGLRQHARSAVAAMASALVLASISSNTIAHAEEAAPAPTAPAKSPSSVDPSERAEILGEGWEASADRAWNTSGDAEGFHILTADAKAGYDWRTVATLREPGFDADQWIGNACVTGSGQRAVVVYAPRSFTNKAQLMARGGFTAVVDLDSGQVTKLDVQTSLSYYNPGCGVGESAVLTQSAGEDKTTTRLLRLDTASATVSAHIEISGQVTSAVPAKDGTIVAAMGTEIVKVGDDGTRSALARSDSPPYRITPDGDGGVVFLDSVAAPGTTSGAQGTTAASIVTQAKRITQDQVRTADADRADPQVLAEGPLTETGVTRSQGTVYLTGKTKKAAAELPGTVRLLPEAPKDALVSTKGQSVLSPSAWADGQDSRVEASGSGSRPVAIDMTVTATGRGTAFTVDPSAVTSPLAAQGSAPSPALPQPRTAAALSSISSGSGTETAESDRTCSVPRNDPRNQAMQPKPRQVEWAADQLVKGTMTLSRPANWKNLGMPAYQPATMFGASGLEGGGKIPAQILLGIAAQESNLWQAARSAVPGETANPLIGNYYGLPIYDSTSANDWDIDWSKADCGYGVTQVTDHMRLAGREGGKGGAAWDYQKQRAVALDYTANLAAGMQIIAEKWNQTRGAGMVVNNGNSAKIENWFFALWAYNSGFYPQAEAGNNAGKWGVGWANNPANPEWDESRNPFLEDASGKNHYADAARPQNWPYPEKVIGFAGHPVEGLESPRTTVAGFRAAWWNGPAGTAQTVGTANYNRARAKPPIATFCAPDNNCDPTKIGTGAANAMGQGPCALADLRCWWNKPVQWKADCDYSCGNEFVRFNSTYPEEADGTAYPPNCSTAGLPTGARIIDDVADDVPSVRPDCARTWTNAGSFTLDFGPGESVKDQNGNPATGWPAKIDTHQLGAGFGGHLFFAHTRADDTKGRRLKVTGTWSLNQPIDGEAEVWVHLPSHAAQTQKARYEVETADGWAPAKTISQKGTTNRWVSLGAYQFAGAPGKVRLTTIADGATGDADIAFDAVAFAPGNYSGIPRIELPEPDETIPDTDDSNQPFKEMDRSPWGQASAVTSARSLTAAQDVSAPAPRVQCGPSDTRKGVTACVGFGEIDGSSPQAGSDHRAVTTAALAAPAAPDTVSACPFEATMYNRYKACLHTKATRPAHYVEVEDRTGKELGRVNFDIMMEIQLHKDSTDIDQIIKIQPVRWEGTVPDLRLNWLVNCTGAPGCKATKQHWDRPTTWTHGDYSTATGGISHYWPNTLAGESAKFDLNYTLEASSSSLPMPRPITWSTQDAGIRCDLKLGKAEVLTNKPGCVFYNYIPTLTLESKKYPAAAALYWVLQDKLNSHPGSKKDKSPLHRVSDPTVFELNRKRICYDGTFVPYPTGVAGDANKPSCDEFPFARSKESGGSNGATGILCAQFYAEKKANAPWALRYTGAAPTGAEPCGRGSIPAGQNSAAGGRLGNFTKEVRLLDDDPYYLNIPGFENCTTVLCTLP